MIDFAATVADAMETKLFAADASEAPQPSD